MVVVVVGILVMLMFMGLMVWVLMVRMGWRRMGLGRREI